MTDVTNPAATAITAARAASGALATARRDIDDWIDCPTLPACAREVLLDIRTELTATSGGPISAQDDMTAATEARSAARRERARQREAFAGNGRKLPPELAEQLDAAVTRAETRFERARASYRSAVERWKAIKALETTVIDFLNSNQDVVAAPALKERKGATVETTRQRLPEIDAALAAAENAPLTRAEIVADLKTEVFAEAAKGAPRIRTRALDGSPARLAQALMVAKGPNGMGLLGDGGAALWCWLFHDELLAALIEQVPPEAPDALSREARAQKIAALQAERLAVERAEEQMIRSARREGRVIARRPDASPEAVLGVQVRGRA